MGTLEYPATLATMAWILTGGFLMSAIALTGGLSVLLQPATLARILLPLVALAAGTLLCGARCACKVLFGR